MPERPRIYGRKTLRKYEGLNLVLLLMAVVGLTVFSTWVFQSYSNPDEGDDSRKEILSEVFTDSDVCMFTVGAQLTHTSHRYGSPAEIITSDPLARKLFGIPGIVEVSIHQKSVVLRKLPSARWEAIRPAARGVITDYLNSE
ncbi:MAG: NifU N-terminal domain-containing protein [Acidobacteriota bacterium]